MTAVQALPAPARTSARRRNSRARASSSFPASLLPCLPAGSANCHNPSGYQLWAHLANHELRVANHAPRSTQGAIKCPLNLLKTNGWRASGRHNFLRFPSARFCRRLASCLFRRRARRHLPRAAHRDYYGAVGRALDEVKAR